MLAGLAGGQMFGEMALLTGQPRTASVVALEATTCAVLEAADFERVLAAHPDVTITIMRVLAARLVDANRHAGVDFVNLGKVQIDARVLALQAVHDDDLPATDRQVRGAAGEDGVGNHAPVAETISRISGLTC